jgi:hypothetical protein
MGCNNDDRMVVIAVLADEIVGDVTLMKMSLDEGSATTWECWGVTWRGNGCCDSRLMMAMIHTQDTMTEADYRKCMKAVGSVRVQLMTIHTPRLRSTGGRCCSNVKWLMTTDR